MNAASKARAGRLLGRAHQALGENALSISVLDAALEITRAGELLLSEGLTVRARALITKAAPSGSSPDIGQQQVTEVMGRMDGGGRQGRALLEKLLLHGL